MSSPINKSPHAFPGSLQGIAVRPGKGEPVIWVANAALIAGQGVVGDRFRGRANSRRQVTLIQSEHLTVIAGLLQLPGLPVPGSDAFMMQVGGVLRRNLVIAGINLLALKGQRFRIGQVEFEYSGLCEPCEKMERALGTGGLAAMCGHGGITARVLTPGTIAVGDALIPQP
jgi:MOSC domain-containing protein YiiM